MSTSRCIAEEEIASTSVPLSSESSQTDRSVENKKRNSSVEDLPDKMYTENTTERYSLGRILGEGAFSVVRKAKRRKDNTIVALKIIDKKETGSIELKREIAIACQVEHPNCIAFYEWTETNTKVIISMELVTGGSLLDKIISFGNYSESDSVLVYLQIASALQYLHSKEIVHRDLKPDNVLLATQESHTNVKLTDFGLSKIYESQDPGMFSTVCGTPQYIPPEVLNVFDGDARKYDGAQMDLYGLGTLLYVLLSGTVPFYDRDEMTMFNKIKNGVWEFHDDKWENVNDGAKEIIKGLMKVNPQERITIEETLSHDWIKKHQEKNVVEAGDDDSGLDDAEDNEVNLRISNLRVNCTK